MSEGLKVLGCYVFIWLVVTPAAMVLGTVALLALVAIGQVLVGAPVDRYYR